VAKLVAAVAPRGARVSVAGTSYGGFVAYHVARLLGLAGVVIASSDLLKDDADDRALLLRSGAERVEDVMLPRSPERMRRLVRPAYHRPRRFTPGFVLRDLVQVTRSVLHTVSCRLLFLNSSNARITPRPCQTCRLYGKLLPEAPKVSRPSYIVIVLAL
jgi:hypothetical protein